MKRRFWMVTVGLFVLTLIVSGIVSYIRVTRSSDSLRESIGGSGIDYRHLPAKDLEGIDSIQASLLPSAAAGDAEARIKYGIFIDFPQCPLATRELLAQERIQVIKTVRIENSIARFAFMQLAHAKVDAARLFLSDYSSDLSQPKERRYYALEALGWYLSPSPFAGGPSRIQPSQKEIQLIESYFQSKNREERLLAISVITAANIKELIPTLTDAFARESNDEVRISILECIGGEGNSEEFPFVLRVSSSNNLRIRKGAVVALSLYATHPTDLTKRQVGQLKTRLQNLSQDTSYQKDVQFGLDWLKKLTPQ